jgi:hypothetical protein
MLWFCRQRFHNGLLSADCCGSGSSSMIPPLEELCVINCCSVCLGKALRCG